MFNVILKFLGAVFLFGCAIVLGYCSVGLMDFLPDSALLGAELAKAGTEKPLAVVATTGGTLLGFFLGANLMFPNKEILVEEPRYSDDDSPDDGFEFPHDVEEEVTSEEERK